MKVFLDINIQGDSHATQKIRILNISMQNPGPVSNSIQVYKKQNVSAKKSYSVSCPNATSNAAFALNRHNKNFKLKN